MRGRLTASREPHKLHKCVQLTPPLIDKFDRIGGNNVKT